MTSLSQILHTPPPEADTQVQLAPVIRSVRSRWWLCGLGTLIGMALALVVLLVVPASYTSSIRVAVGQSLAAGKSTSSSPDMEAEVTLASSPAVLEHARAAAGGSFLPVTAAPDVRAVPDSSLIELSVTADSPEASAAAATRLADSYLAIRAERLDGERDAARDAIGLQIERLAHEIETLEADGQRGTVRDEIARRELDALATTQAGYLSPVAGGTVVDAPTAADAVASPDPVRTVALGALAGLFVGTTAAGAWHLTRRTVTSAADLGRLMGVPSREVGAGSRAALAERISHTVGLSALRLPAPGLIVFGTSWPDLRIDDPHGQELPRWRFLDRAIVPRGTSPVKTLIALVPAGTPTADVVAFRREARGLGLNVDRALLLPATINW